MLWFCASEIRSAVGVIIRFGLITDNNQQVYHKQSQQPQQQPRRIVKTDYGLGKSTYVMILYPSLLTTRRVFCPSDRQSASGIDVTSFLSLQVVC